MRRKLIAGNWKMNGNADTRAAVAALPVPEAVDVVVCPPATLVSGVSEVAAARGIATGGQNCHADVTGAYTGDVSAEMLHVVGASYVIVGHSERRAGYGESDADVAAKAKAAERANLVPIICLGETLAERKSGRALEVILAQLNGSLPPDMGAVVIAYEPIWAIGTGEVATVAQIAEVHAALRAALGERGAETRILYGGSVNPGNAAEIFAVADVDGALVGGASLSAETFSPIIEAAARA